MAEARDSRGVLITVDIWLSSLYIAPVLIIIANYFRPNPRLYFFPLLMFFYAGAVYFSPVIGNEVNYLQLNSWLFFLASFFGSICFMYMLKHVRRITLLEDNDSKFYEDIEDGVERLIEENKLLKEKLNQETNRYERSGVLTTKKNA